MEMIREKIEIEFMVGDFCISPKDLPNGLLGRIMRDIVFCSPDCCRDKAAYLELVRGTAEEIQELFQSQLKESLERVRGTFKKIVIGQPEIIGWNAKVSDLDKKIDTELKRLEEQ